MPLAGTWLAVLVFMKPGSFALLIFLAACGRSEPIDLSSLAPSIVATTSPPPSSEPHPSCRVELKSTHPLIKITLPAQPCNFTLAQARQGLHFRYRVEVAPEDQAILWWTQSEVPLMLSCPQKHPSGLYVAEGVSGNDQSYCLCDEGRCLRPEPVTNPPSGTTDSTFAWEGLNWSGPSDTGNPAGSPFPPGQYVFEVITRGIWGDKQGVPWEASAKLFMTLSP